MPRRPRAATWLHVARVLKGQLSSHWRFYTGHGWSRIPRASVRVLAGISAVSMLDLGKRGLRLISQRPTFGHAVYSWHAETPVGPFVKRRKIYETGSYGERTFTYSTLADPQYVRHGTMLFSFNVNSLDVLNPSTASLYRPRSFRLVLGSL